jgi:hypothetical protein
MGQTRQHQRPAGETRSDHAAQRAHHGVAEYRAEVGAQAAQEDESLISRRIRSGAALEL